ncbi:mRNA capping enzyme, catalytic domain-containing protein [Irpex rosettiformis]|uniref:mRNA capping enzyme, catalytic domain-containing protein n=1 Tax=Irpex rosettiformis TaxID=378272 RepID=A0ACB8UHW4_9APHY|nr:mRNA capping enzyme, catalytic domain-containing protein [Irpex rosettiformis]
MPRIPDIPGSLIPGRSDQERWLRQHVARLCQLDHERFPGSQPVSFSTNDIEKLESQDYWVCEKSDGVRVLLLVQTDSQTKAQSVYLIDRHNTYREVAGLFFPHHENPINPLRNTLVDGELVIDVDPRTKQETLRFLAFDCLVVDDQNVMSRTLDKRYGRLQAWFHKPYSKMLQDHPQVRQAQPFEIKVKDVQASYNVDQVFERDIPNLQHGNDGLIYTCVNTPYTSGTDPNILKWKPPSENSIDFKLVLRFPPLPEKPSLPDYCAKPIFQLHTWCGGKDYALYDVMEVSDEEWESMKASGEQMDDRIVEVHWDTSVKGWRMMRFRDDKPNGNHQSVVDNIIKSIADGVEKDNLLAHSNSIRNAWKTRQSQVSSLPPPPLLPSKPPPLLQSGYGQPPTPLSHRPSIPERIPDVKAKYGPLGSSPWSKVAGPAMVAGMYR